MAGADKAADGRTPGLSVIGIVTLLGVTLGAAGAGVGSSVYLVEFAKQRLAEEQRKALTETTAEADIAPGLRLVRLEPMIVNLRSPADTWIRLEASVLFDPGAGLASMDAIKATVQADVFAYVATLDLSAVEGAVGLAALREDLTRRARIRLGDVIRDVVVHALILQ